jgi:hypothetical protein
MGTLKDGERSLESNFREKLLDLTRKCFDDSISCRQYLAGRRGRVDRLNLEHRPEATVREPFFHPERQVQTVRKVFRFTADVNDVVPVTVGPMRSWFVC